MKILHIAAHIGGGIGSAYAGLGNCGQEQRILLLEEPIDQTSIAKVGSAGFRILTGLDRKSVERELYEADVVVFSWHHHPALARFLHEFPTVPIRSILWCHVSGNYFPYIAADFLTMFDQVMFATPFSLELPQVRQLGNTYICAHCDVVYGLNDLSRFEHILKQPHEGFNIGYVGTLGFCKLHPEFVDFCAAVNLPDEKFVIAGTPSTKEQILKRAAKRGIAGQFEFLGQVSDVPGVLSQMDVFGYLLNPQHFGATENALLEAMAVGLPVVALNQCVEARIIKDGVTGLLVRSPEEYGNAVRYLRENPDKAGLIGVAAREDVQKRYAIQPNRQRFLSTCQKAVSTEKRFHHFERFHTGEPANWFLSAVLKNRECFEENRAMDAGLIFHERTKGSPIHYHIYFPEDAQLAYWAAQLKCPTNLSQESYHN